MHNFVVLLGNVNGLEIICNFALVDLWHSANKTVFASKP